MFDLRPNYGGGNEDNGASLKRSHALLHSVSPTLQQATIDPCLCWRLLDTHRQVWVSLVGSLFPSPGSWCTRFCLCPPRVYFPVLCKFWQLCGGVNGDLLQEGLCHTQVCCTQSPVPATEHYQPIPPQETLKHNSVSVSVGSWVLRICLSPLSISGGNGV